MARPLRYTFILALVALGACLAAFSGWRYARASAPVNGPIILVSIDALRADRLPTYGYKAGRTPAIDALARDGIVFERAYSHVPQTLPAHAALLSGRLPFDTGVRDGVGFKVKEDERLLAEMLRDRGYATAGVVSSFTLRKETGIGQGFTVFDAGAVGKEASTPPLVRDGSSSEQIAERWLESAGTTRAFLFLHLAEPAVSSLTSGEPPLTYDARVSKADDVVGALVRYLKTHQLYDQSTIILVADHGQGLGEHGETEHGLLVYEEALRVPLIIKQAAGKGGGRVRALVQHIDVVPTILDLAKAPLPGNLRGESLVPLFRGGQDDDGSRVAYAESMYGQQHFGWEPLVSLTDGNYRYIAKGTAELYDISPEGSMRGDIATASPDVVARFERVLTELAKDSALKATAQAEPIDADDRSALDLLGYVGAVIGTANPDGTAPVEPAVVEQYRRAVRLRAPHELPEAIESFRSLTDMQPRSIDLWLQLALVATRAERHDIAADAYRRVMSGLPDAPLGYVGTATALLRGRKFDEAKTVAQRLLEAPLGQAAKAAGHELLARIALSRRQYDVARAEAEHAEQLDAARPVLAYVNGRIATDQRRHDEALAAFDAALATIDTHKGAPLGDLRLDAAEAMVRADRLPEAEFLFLEQLKEAPVNPRALAGLAALYRATGRTGEAARLGEQ